LSTETQPQETRFDRSTLQEISALGDEFAGLTKLREREDWTRRGLMKVIAQMQQSMGDPIRLKATSLGPEHPRVKSARIEGENVVFRVEHKREKVSVPLADLDYDVFMALIGEAVRIVSDAASVRRRQKLEEIMPRLSISVREKDGRMGLFGNPGHELVISNVGGDARSVTVTSTWEGRVRSVGGLEVPQGVNLEVELKSIRTGAGSPPMTFKISCVDREGNPYSGSAAAGIADGKWHKVAISLTEEEGGAAPQ
jgi:hypothetical protein